MTTNDKLESIGNRLDTVLDQRPPTDLIHFFHASLMKRRHESNPSQENFELGRTIACGMAMGFRFAKQFPEVGEAEIMNLVKEGIKEGAN